MGGELRAMLSDNLFEVGKSLDLIKQGRIGSRISKKLNLGSGAFVSNANGAECGVEESHNALVACASVGRVILVQGVQGRIGAM